MKEELSTILKGAENYKVEIIINEQEIKIQRDTRSLWGVVLLSLLFVFAAVAILFMKFENKTPAILLTSTFLSIFSLFFVVYSINDLVKAKKTNRRIFKLSEIKLVKAKIKKKTINLSFEFYDKTKDKSIIEKSDNFNIFQEILKKNNILINTLNM